VSGEDSDGREDVDSTYTDYGSEETQSAASVDDDDDDDDDGQILVTTCGQVWLW
jgi:hypothetical protein